MYLGTFSKHQTFTKMINSYFNPNSISKIDYKNPSSLQNITTLIVRLPQNVELDFEYIKSTFETYYPIGVIETCNKNTNVEFGGVVQHLFVFRFNRIFLGTQPVNQLHSAITQYGYNDIMICINETYSVTIRVFCDCRIDSNIKSSLEPSNFPNRENNHVHTYNVHTIFTQQMNKHQSQVKGMIEEVQIEMDSLKQDLRSDTKSIVEADIKQLTDENAKLWEKIKDLDTNLTPHTQDTTTSKICELESTIQTLNKKVEQSEKKIAETAEELKWWRKGLYNKIEMLKCDFKSMVKDEIYDVEKRISKSIDRQSTPFSPTSVTQAPWNNETKRYDSRSNRDTNRSNRDTSRSNRDTSRSNRDTSRSNRDTSRSNRDY